MFNLTKTKKFEATVEISDCGNNGNFKVEFEKIPQDERMAIVEEEGVTALLDRVVVRVWDIQVDGVNDDDEIRQIVINDTPCSNALLRAYNKKTDGIVRKNSKKSQRRSARFQA